MIVLCGKDNEFLNCTLWNYCSSDCKFIIVIFIILGQEAGLDPYGESKFSGILVFEVAIVLIQGTNKLIVFA